MNCVSSWLIGPLKAAAGNNICNCDQTADHLTLENYKKFMQICTEEEWQIYESNLLGKLNRSWTSNQLDILMHRKDYEKSQAVLIKEKYPNWDSGSVPQTAKMLEIRFPDQILAYYLSGFKNMNRESTHRDMPHGQRSCSKSGG
jgi:hypothetical protein